MTSRFAVSLKTENWKLKLFNKLFHAPKIQQTAKWWHLAEVWDSFQSAEIKNKWIEIHDSFQVLKCVRKICNFFKLLKIRKMRILELTVAVKVV